jgi:uncharacterized protein YkwD
VIEAPAALPEALRIIELVNIYRVSLSLRPLEYHPAIARVAQAHVNQIVAGTARYSHDGLDERVAELSQRVRYRTVAENLAQIPGSTPVPMERAVSRWISSDAHRQAMEGCYELTGVGVARTAAGTWYLSQLFVRRAEAQPMEAWGSSALVEPRCR